MNRSMIVPAFVLLLGGCTIPQQLRGDNPAVQATIGRKPMQPAEITVIFDGIAYAGPSGPTRVDPHGSHAARFGWPAVRKHRRAEGLARQAHAAPAFFIGTATLRAANGSSLSCEHLTQSGGWRLICTAPDGKSFRIAASLG